MMNFPLDCGQRQSEKMKEEDCGQSDETLSPRSTGLRLVEDKKQSTKMN